VKCSTLSLRKCFGLVFSSIEVRVAIAKAD
jgi:hypothetical protein